MGTATDHAQLLNTWLKSTHIGGPQVMLTAPAPSTDVDCTYAQYGADPPSAGGQWTSIT